MRALALFALLPFVTASARPAIPVPTTSRANISGNMAYGVGASVGVNGLAVAGCRLAGNTSGPFDTSVASGVHFAANVVGAFPAV